MNAVAFGLVCFFGLLATLVIVAFCQWMLDDTSEVGQSAWLQRLRGFRTVFIGTLTSAAGILLVVIDQMSVLPMDRVIPAKFMPWWMVGTGVAVILLRLITTGPVGKK